MLWECKEKHQWGIPFNNILNDNNWCHYCSPSLKKTLEFCQNLALQKGGKCLSTEYINSITPMLWECDVKHQWETNSDSIFHMDSWCPYCSNNAHKTTEQFIQEANIIKNNTYDYSEFKYINAHIPGNIICHKKYKDGEEHELFWQSPSNHLCGKGCPECTNNISKISQLWLDQLQIPNDKEHREVRVIPGRRIRVDGFDPILKIAYEFYGDSWHGNLVIYNPNDINTANHKTYGQLYQEMLEKEQLLKEAGYTIVSIWESDFRKEFREQLDI